MNSSTVHITGWMVQGGRCWRCGSGSLCAVTQAGSSGAPSPEPRLALPSAAGAEITKGVSRYFGLPEGPAAEETSCMQAALSDGFLITPTSPHMTVAEMEAEGLWKLQDPWHSCRVPRPASSCPEEMLVRAR